MKPLFSSVLLLGLFSLSLVVRADQVVATAPAGVVRLTASGASDTALALPLVQGSAYLGRVVGVGASSLTLASAPQLEAGRSYYLQFVTGSLRGLCYPVSSVSSVTLSLNTQGDELSTHPLGSILVGQSGDLVRLRPAWTVSDVFGQPSSTQLASVASMHPVVHEQGDAIGIYVPGEDASVGPARWVSPVAGAGWRTRGAGDTDASGQAFWPGQSLLLRREASQSVTVLLLGYVAQGDFVTRLPAVPQDRDLEYPVSLERGDLVLAGALSLKQVSGLSLLQAVSSDADAGDALFVTEDGAGFQAAPSSRIQLVDTSWMDSAVAAGGRVLPSTRGFVIRLRAGRSASYWLQPGTF